MGQKLEFRSLRTVVLPDEEIISAIQKTVAFDHVDEACAVLQEARAGNMVAQHIVGIALLQAGHKEAARAWFSLSAEQGFEPAKLQLIKVG